MITLRISFLLAIDLKVKEVVEKPPKKKKKPGKAEKPKKIKEEVIEENGEDKPYSTIKVEEPLATIHVEYELFGGYFKYDVDIICWGSVAKLYSPSGIRCFKTIVNGDTAWVPIFIEHFLDNLKTEEVLLLLDNTITFNIKLTKNSMGTLAKSDKNLPLYIYKEDEATGKDFVEVYYQKPLNVDNETIKSEIERILQEILSFPFPGEIISWIHHRYDVHDCQISNIIRKRKCNEEINCREPEIEEEKSTNNSGGKGGGKGSWNSKKSLKGSKSKSSKKSGKSDEIPEGRTNIKFKIPGNIFLTDSFLAIYKLKTTGAKVVETYVFLSSENLLTLRQKHDLNPLIVKIRKISNLPIDILTQNGFKNLQIHCNIPGFVEFQTKPKPISDTINFDESKLIYTNLIPPIKRVEFLQTRRVIVQIFGLKQIVQVQETQPKEEKKSKKSKKKENSEVDIPIIEPSTQSILLSVAHFDMSSLSNSHSLLKEKTPCHNSSSLFLQTGNPNDEGFMDHLNVNELNLIVYHNKTSSLLTEELLLSHNTTFKLEAGFLIPQYPSFYVKDRTYKRFLLIIFEEEAAKLIFNSVMLYNHEIKMNKGPVILPNFYMKNYEDNDDDDVLSGFIIDDGNCFIFCVEGPSRGYILSLLHQVSTYNYTVAKVFYNSEFLFEERMYKGIFKFSGFFPITLKMPLCDLFSAKEIFIKGNVPIPCFKAIQKLNLIINSTTFKSILNYNLLPTEIELVSLSVEFGLQVGFKSKEMKNAMNDSQLVISHIDLGKM